jgi:tetratricopeptide (TPR) repeat protein
MTVEQLLQAHDQASGLFPMPPAISTNLIASASGALATEDIDAALRAAHAAVALVEKTEQIASWSAALVVLADAERRAGNTLDAEEHLRHAIELRQTAGVAGTIPAVWFLEAGKLALDRRDTKLALWTYETALESIRAREQQGDDISHWARDEARLRLRAADIHFTRQHLAEAQKEAKRAHEVLWAAAQVPIDDVMVMDSLFRLLIELGTFQRRCADNTGAISSFHTAVELGREMITRSGQTIDKHRALSFALNRLAEVRLEKRDVEGSLAAYSEALEIRRQLAQMLPNDNVISKDLSSALRKVSRILRFRGAVPEACAALRESIIVDEERAHRLGRADASLMRMLALSYGQLAQWSPPDDEAIDLATRGVEIASELDAVQGAKDVWRQNLLIRAEIYHKVGDLPRAVDDENEAEHLSADSSKIQVGWRVNESGDFQH